MKKLFLYFNIASEYTLITLTHLNKTFASHSMLGIFCQMKLHEHFVDTEKENFIDVVCFKVFFFEFNLLNTHA